MSQGTILITGLNGYLAGRVAEAVLKAGYDVRGTVRNIVAGKKVEDALVGTGYGGKVEVVEVTYGTELMLNYSCLKTRKWKADPQRSRDIAAPGAFDEAVAGCYAVLHVAAPIGEVMTTRAPEIVRKAVESTTGILDSALRAGPGLQSVVLMSSVAAMMDLPPEPRPYSEKDWNTKSEEIVRTYGSEAPFYMAYAAAKTASERVFWEFRLEKKPAFALTAILAPYFTGPPLVAWETTERIPFTITNIWAVLCGDDFPPPLMGSECMVDIRDVARLLVWSALNPKIADGERYLCAGGVGGSQAISDILSKRIPELKIKHGTPGQGYLPDYSAQPGSTSFDARKAVEATGQDWIGFETSVVDTAEVLKQYL